jgi:hypothetical protein
MKKKYISPNVLVVAVRSCGIIATSLGLNAEGADDGVVLTREYDAPTSSSSSNIFDEEW